VIVVTPDITYQNKLEFATDSRDKLLVSKVAILAGIKCCQLWNDYLRERGRGVNMNKCFICLSFVLLITLPWSSATLYGDIHSVAQIDDLVGAGPKDNLSLAVSMDIVSRMPLLRPTPFYIGADRKDKLPFRS
jgi:hypothetical protein